MWGNRTPGSGAAQPGMIYFVVRVYCGCMYNNQEFVENVKCYSYVKYTNTSKESVIQGKEKTNGRVHN